MFKVSRHSHKTLSIIKAFIARSKVAAVTQKLKRAKPQLEKLISLGNVYRRLG
ncbi:MAG: hypothetical protein ACKFI0_00175 [Candidatus Hodgkinia cicadicola]